MNILVFNCGSSSLGFKLFAISSLEYHPIIFSGKAHRVGVVGSEPSFIEYHFQGHDAKEITPLKTHQEAAENVVNFIRKNNILIDYIGHRFVHGGNYFSDSAMIDGSVLQKLQACLPLAPIHNPVSLSVIYACRKSFQDIPEYVTFDSAFHSSIPVYAYTYLLPKKISDRFTFRKYGFHGLSYTYVTRETARYLGTVPEKLRIVACHLGTGGSSVAAIRSGHSIDTSMGYSPLPGLMMSTRSGDIDPMLAIYLMAVYGYRPDDLLNLLNKKSGILGISGFSSDIRDIVDEIAQLASGSSSKNHHSADSTQGKQAELALAMYIHRLKKYIGSYISVLEGIEALVFTDDIGIQNWLVREKVCSNMEWCGIQLDTDLNQKAAVKNICQVNTSGSKVQILTIPTQEELVIAWEGLKLIQTQEGNYASTH